MNDLHSRLGGMQAQTLRPDEIAAIERAAGILDPADLGATVIRTQDELTTDTAQDLYDDIEEAAASTPTVIVDLGSTTLLTAAGLGALVSGSMRCRDAGGELRLAGAEGLLRKALRFTRIDSALPTFPTVEDALRDLL